MTVQQFKYAADNFGYVIHGRSRAMVVDGGAVRGIISFVNQKRLKITHVTNTHTHADHTMGVRDLLQQTGAVYLDSSALRNQPFIELEGEEIAVYHTPGHTTDSFVFHSGNILVTGDTLFNGTVGNCFSGDLKSFYHSIKKLMEFPGDTIIYAGHDYVLESMEFAKKLEPENTHIDRFLGKYDPGHVYSTLSEELMINPYLRFNKTKIVRLLQQKGLPVETEYERWESLMSIE